VIFLSLASFIRECDGRKGDTLMESVTEHFYVEICDVTSSLFLLVMKCRCSGCVIDVGLDQPPIMNEAKAFFAGRGVPSFSLAPGPLVIYSPLLGVGTCILGHLVFF